MDLAQQITGPLDPHLQEVPALGVVDAPPLANVPGEIAGRQSRLDFGIQPGRAHTHLGGQSLQKMFRQQSDVLPPSNTPDTRRISFHGRARLLPSPNFFEPETRSGLGRSLALPAWFANPPGRLNAVHAWHPTSASIRDNTSLFCGLSSTTNALTWHPFLSLAPRPTDFGLSTLASGSPVTNGRVKWNRDPSPSRDSTRNSPPINSTCCRDRANPSPVPPFFCPSLPCWKGWNSRACTSGESRVSASLASTRNQGLRSPGHAGPPGRVAPAARNASVA